MAGVKCHSKRGFDDRGKAARWFDSVYPDDATAQDVAQAIGSRLANAVVAAEVEGRVATRRCRWPS
jgi:hypothetical protein